MHKNINLKNMQNIFCPPCAVGLVDVPELELAVRRGGHNVCAVQELHIGDGFSVALGTIVIPFLESLIIP